MLPVGFERRCRQAVRAAHRPMEEFCFPGWHMREAFMFRSNRRGGGQPADARRVREALRELAGNAAPATIAGGLFDGERLLLVVETDEGAACFNEAFVLAAKGLRLMMGESGQMWHLLGYDGDRLVLIAAEVRWRQ